MTNAADDFAFIGARLREVQTDPLSQTHSGMWWCYHCQKEIDGRNVDSQERHNGPTDGCGCIVHQACDRCDNGGWVPFHSSCPPAFEQCPKCFNPFGHQSP